MTDTLVQATPARARRNRWLRVWSQQCGTPAMAALAVAAVAVLLQSQVQPAQHRAFAAAVQQRAQAERIASTLPKTGAANPAAAVDPLRKAVPDVASRGQDVGKLLALARQTGLTVDRADYGVESVSGAPLTRLHANLPVSGSYANIRRFIAEMLNAMPNATLESLQLERADTQSERLQATLRIVLFYRAVRT